MPKRIRRTAQDARRIILEAAEAAMAAHGPAGIRLTDVAKAAGVSHPTVLHHFGNREGLIVALNRRTLEDLRLKLVDLLQGAGTSNEDAVGPTFAAYRNGLARRIVWLLQESQTPPPQNLPLFEEIVERLHRLRVRLAPPGRKPDLFDSRALVHLMTITAFGDAIIGPRLRAAASPQDEEAQRRRFEKWFGALLDAHTPGETAKK